MFLDRHDAAVSLARALEKYRDDKPLILGLPRGGVPIAAHVAHHLHTDFDVVIVRKLGAPFNPEYAIGAVGEGGVTYLNNAAIAQVGVGESELRDMISVKIDEINDRVLKFRAGHPMPAVADRTVIIIDDGLATGATAIAALQVLRKLGASHIVLAVPVGATESLDRVTHYADEVVCVDQPRWFGSVGEFYEDFTQVTDADVVALLAERALDPVAFSGEVRIPIAPYASLPGFCTIPEDAIGVVAFAHGSGSSRHSTRNQSVARYLNESGIGTLLFDLLTDEESLDRRNVFDIQLLAERLGYAKRFLRSFDVTSHLPIGYFGASTGAGAALVAAASDPTDVRAVVSRGGRPDLAGPWLGHVTAPTLLIVGGHDVEVLLLNEQAQAQLTCENALAVVPGATHLFEEPGTLELAAKHAANWFTRHLSG